MVLSMRNFTARIYRFTCDPQMPWFQAKPVTLFLEYNNVTHALVNVDPEDKSSLEDLIKAKGAPVGASGFLEYSDKKAIYINEFGLYGLIMGSRRPAAKDFRRWVTREVLPWVRRNGHCDVDQQVAKLCSSGPRALCEAAGRDHLYVMQYSSGGSVKIGRSFNVEKRRRQLMACQDFRIRVLQRYPRKGFLEPHIHRLLQSKRSRGGPGVEWFQVSAADAHAVICQTIRTGKRIRNGVKRWQRLVVHSEPSEPI